MLQNRFKKILVALDGSVPSRRGMNEAVSLARQSNGSITGIHILPDIHIGRTVTFTYRKILSKKSKNLCRMAKF
jgi:nucleotide-binding universal stress UspA family protein